MKLSMRASQGGRVLRRGQLWAALLVMAIASIFSPLAANTYAATATVVDFSNKNLPMVRVNRTLIKVGDAASGIAWFYGSDSTYQAIGLTCSATLMRADMLTEPENSATTWIIEWFPPFEGKQECQTVKSTVKRTDTPKNEAERMWTVFYKKDNTLLSVLKDNKTIFTKRGTWQPETTPPHTQDVYIEDGVQAIDCPSVIRYSTYDDKWVYIPMWKASSAEDSSDQYASLMNRAYGTTPGDVKCTPTDSDSLGLFTRFGLPENYYNRGSDHLNDVTTDFGFRDAGNHSQDGVNANLYGAVLLGGVPGLEAQGIGAFGDNANGAGIGNGEGIPADRDGKGSPDPSVPTCTIENIGWIVCPVTNFLASIADGALNILNSLFYVPATKLFDTSGQAYNAWQQIRNYANIIFVIVFLIIIFSQVTSVGITNYGIKKLLPKLVATALVVNLSFPICALLIDASNLLGYSLASFLDNTVKVTLATGAEAKGWDQGSVFGGIASTALILGATVAATYFALAAVVGVLVSVVAIGVTMVMLLGIRQALIVLLVVLSPLAFVAMLLPNTEPLFKKWLKLFKSMLLIFPIASLLYGAGKLASNVLMAASEENMIIEIIAASLPIIMLVAIYKVFSAAMNAVEGVGGFANGLRGGLNKMGNPLKNLAAKNDQLNKQKFMAGKGLIGTRNLGKFANRRAASYNTKMQTAKDIADANAAQFVSQNQRMQNYTNRSAAANQLKKNSQLNTSNMGRQHVYDEHGNLLQEEGKLKEVEREIDEKEKTVKIDASGLERSLADIAAQIKNNAESNAANESKDKMQTNRPDLIAKEGLLKETARKLDNVSKTIQTTDPNATAEFIEANKAGEELKEMESKRDANWKGTIASSDELTKQQVRIEGQQARGKAAEGAVNATVKEEMAAGTMEIDDGSGGTVNLRTLRQQTQNADMDTKLAEADIQAQDDERAATDPTLVSIANQTRAQVNRAGEAKRVQTTKYRDAILDATDPTIINIAGGEIAGHREEGQQRAQAGAQAEVSRARAEGVTNARVQFETASSDKAAVTIATTGRRLPPAGSPPGTVGDTATAEEIEAASLHLLERGSHGDKLRVIRGVATATAALPIEEQKAVRSSLSNAYVKSSLADLGGKDFASQIRDVDTIPSPDFDGKVLANINKLKPEALAKDLKYAETIHDLYTSPSTTPAQRAAMEPVLDNLINTIRSNPTLSTSADTATKAMIDDIANAMNTTSPGSYTGAGTWAVS